MGLPCPPIFKIKYEKYTTRTNQTHKTPDF